MHSAQGVTADTTHAVLGDRTSRNLLYVAMTRGKESNQAYLYERIAGEGEHEHGNPEPGVHVMRRGTTHQAAVLVRGIIGNRDDRARTAHQVAADTDRVRLPDQVASLLDQHDRVLQGRRDAHRRQREAVHEQALDRQREKERHLSRNQDRSQDYGLGL